MLVALLRGRRELHVGGDLENTSSPIAKSTCVSVSATRAPSRIVNFVALAAFVGALYARVARLAALARAQWLEGAGVGAFRIKNVSTCAPGRRAACGWRRRAHGAGATALAPSGERQ